jgi:hypothetical protein
VKLDCIILGGKLCATGLNKFGRGLIVWNWILYVWCVQIVWNWTVKVWEANSSELDCIGLGANCVELDSIVLGGKFC